MEILNMINQELLDSGTKLNQELLDIGTEIGKLMRQAYIDKDYDTWDSLKIELEEVYGKLK
jgi:hypothetical protein